MEEEKKRNPFLKNLDVYLATIGRDRGYLSRVSGVNHNTINALFAFNRWPRLDTAVQIAEGLGLSLEYLLTGHDERLEMTVTQQEILDMTKELPDQKVKELRAALTMWLFMEQQSRS